MIVVGVSLENQQAVQLSEEAHTLSTYLIGRPGHGKSHVMAELIRDDLVNGRGLVVLDPHGTLVEDVVAAIPRERAGDVYLLDCGDRQRSFGLNLFDCADSRDPAAVSFTVDQFVSTFRKIWHEAWGARLEALLRNICHLAIETSGFTLAEVPRLLDEETYRKQLTGQLSNPVARRYWERYNHLSPHQRSERSESTMVRIDAFLSNPIIRAIVGQQTSIDFAAVAQAQKILFVDLAVGQIGNAAVSLLGSVLTNRLIGQLQSRNQPEPVIHLYADEVQRFVAPVFSTAFNEMRKFGLAPTTANQVLSDLEPSQRSAMLGANTLIAFSLGGEGDARVVAEKFRASPEYPEKIRAADPWSELKRNGSRIPALHDALYQTQMLISEYEEVLEYSWGLDSPAGYNPKNTFVDKSLVDYNRVRSAVQELENNIRLFAAKYQEEPERLIIRGTITEMGLDIYESWSRIPRGAYEPDYLEPMRETQMAHWSQLFFDILEQLWVAVRDNPIWSPEWEAAQVNGPKRLVTEIFNEHINQLATLPRYEAWVTVGERGGRHEYRMRTRPPAPEQADVAAMQIVLRNYDTYTRERADVLAELDELDQDDDGTAATPAAKPPKPDTSGPGALADEARPRPTWRRREPLDHV